MVAPNPVTDPIGALSAIATDPMRHMIEQQQRGQADIENLQKLAEESRATDPAERWANMAKAAATVPPVVGSFGALLAQIGGAYGSTLAAQNQRNLQNQLEIAKARQSMGMGQGSLTAMTQAMLDPYRFVPGIGLTRKADATVALPSSLIPEYNRLYEQHLKDAREQKHPNAEAWARSMADYDIQRVMRDPSVAGGRTTSPSEPTQVAMPPATQQAALGRTDPTFPRADDTAESLGTRLQLLREEMRRYGDNPEVVRDLRKQELEVQRKLNALPAAPATPATTPTPAPAETTPPAAQIPGAPPALPYRDEPKSAMEKATGEVTGKKLGEEYDALQGAASSSVMLKTQLSTLRELLKTPNLPAGAMGESLQNIRSSLSTLGIDIGKEVGAADMINAIGGKVALLTRTAEGSNLMPGAMSDFEQRILRSLAPGLQQTPEGRAALVDFLIDMADVRIRLASEANKLAAANRGILPPDWYARRDRVLKEEQARLALRAREMAKRFQGAK